jgi:hypothetical protein
LGLAISKQLVVLMEGQIGVESEPGKDATAPYAGKSYSIFLQGSYGNDTNIYADSDVDVVMRLASTFYHDLDDLSEDQKNAFTRCMRARPSIVRCRRRGA